MLKRLFLYIIVGKVRAVILAQSPRWCFDMFLSYRIPSMMDSTSSKPRVDVYGSVGTRVLMER